MFFAIRDDDLNYFTNPRQLENIYDGIWDTCPISFSAVPFHACTITGAIPKKYWQGEKIFSLGENRELTEFVAQGIQKNNICITLHGYNHKDNPEGYEFEANVNLVDKVAEGKTYLENLFGRPINVFIPPHNRISKKGLKAVIKNDLHLANVPPFRDRGGFLRPSVIIPTLRRKMFSLKYPCRVYPYVLDFADHKEVACHSLIPRTRLDDLLQKFAFCNRMNGVFILAAHYWEYNTPCIHHHNWKMKDVLFRFWDAVCEKSNVRFVALDQVFDDKP